MSPIKPMNLKGRRFGALVVTGFAGFARYQCGLRHRVWAVRCDCGLTEKVLGPRLTCSGGKVRCSACSQRAAADAKSVLLSTGETLVQISRRTGVRLNTLQQRLQRGWPHERIAEPTHAAPQKHVRALLARTGRAP